MRLSCNGCRVLRKGCSENCPIKPCLLWIKSPQAQANATVFLAKFYGRAGLLNLINTAPEHSRPGVFKSLLYEACGRIVNPICGSVGLLWSGNWQLCQAAVEAVLSGSPISQVSTDSAVSSPLKAFDVRHVSKDESSAGSSAGRDLHKVNGKTKRKFKRAGMNPKVRSSSPDVDGAARVMWSWCHKEEVVAGSPSRDSGVSQQDEPLIGESPGGEADCESVETVETSLAKPNEEADGSDVELELTLGSEPVAGQGRVGPVKADGGIRSPNGSTCKIELGLDWPI